jgi:signal transduction histidine kinase
MNISARGKYGVSCTTNGMAVGWARIDKNTVIGCKMPSFKPEDRTTLYLIGVGATIVALLFFILFMGGVLLARAAKRAREDLKVKNTFLDVISHELNTPLGSIVPLSSALSSGLIKEPSRQAEAIATISRESERMARMVSELLTVVRLKNKKLIFSREKVNIPEVVDNAVSLVRLRYPDCAIMIAGGDDVFVLADNDKTQQVLVNLLENACRYAGDDDIQVSWCCNADGYVCVQVSDRGPGISEEERKHLFERFYQASTHDGVSNGLGLGLNIVLGFTKGMGGNVEVCSREGGGSVFSVTLPVFLHKSEGVS